MASLVEVVMAWGVSTRVIGGLIMGHGDDRGLRLPPAVAPTQVVLLAVRDETIDLCHRMAADLVAQGVRAEVDDATRTGFGRRATDWELKGVPVRLEIGPRDVEAGQATVARRDRGDKEQLPLDTVVGSMPSLLDEIQQTLYDEALVFRESRTAEAGTIDEVDGDGAFRIPWSAVGVDGEQALAQRGFTIRCLQTGDGGLPTWDQADDLVAVVARAY